MSDSFSTYMDWVRRHKNVWAFERDEGQSTITASTLRTAHSTILAALTSVPAFIHPKSQIHASAIIGGAVTIEEGAQVLADAVINGPAFIGRNAVVGNYSLLRGSCFLARDSLVGNHSYCNESVIGRSARVAHFAHFSRSIIAYNSAVSAFVLTATVKADESPIVRSQNEQGSTTKLGCVIGSNTFVASHVLLLPGVTVGDRCFIGSMLVLNKDVPDDTFVEVERTITTRPNDISIPRRARLGDFLSSDVLSIDYKYAAILLVSIDRRLILQRRDSSIGTYNPGKLSAFGGRLEGTETLPECAIRELYEETGLRAKEEDLQFLVDVLVATDFGNTFCSLYALENVNPANITISEGIGFEMFSEEEAVHQPDLTELCRTAILEYYKLH